MTPQELIQQLQKLDPDTYIDVRLDHQDQTSCSYVVFFENLNNALVESE